MKCKHDRCDNPRISDRQSCRPCKHLTQQYGITTPERDDILKEQGGRCVICESQISFDNKPGGKHGANVDHCHTHGHVRGILCGPCNTGLGKFYDSVELLENAQRYLEDNDDEHN